jgi:hypothetical protein
MLIFGLGLHCNPEHVVDELVPFIAEDKGLRKGRDEKSSLDKLSWLSIRREYVVTNDWLVLLSYDLGKGTRGNPFRKDRFAGERGARPREGAGETIMRGRVGSARRATLQLGDALVLIFGLHRQAVVETLEFSGKGRERLIGDLQLGVEFLDDAVG